MDLRPAKVGKEGVDTEDGCWVVLVEESWRRAAEGERVAAAWERAKDDAAMATFRERKRGLRQKARARKQRDRWGRRCR